jgi:hypothetical protein
MTAHIRADMSGVALDAMWAFACRHPWAFGALCGAVFAVPLLFVWPTLSIVSVILGTVVIGRSWREGGRSRAAYESQRRNRDT